MKPVKKIIIIFVALVFLNIGFIPKAQAAVSASTLVTLANNSRSQAGLGPLSTNSSLEAAANAKANDMFEKDYFSHTSPAGKTPWDFIREAGYGYIYAGENLAIGYSSSQELHNDWMNSPSHRENIIHPNFRDVGIAVLNGDFEGTPTTIVVQMFGSQIAGENVVAESESSAESSASEEEATGQTEESVPSETVIEKSHPLKKFEIITEKTGYQPQKIFSGENVKFTITFKGEVKEIIATVGQNTINLMENNQAKKIEGNQVFEKTAKIEEVGVLPVSVKISDSLGNEEVLELKNLSVAEKVIAKESRPEKTGFLANVLEFAQDNLVYLALMVIMMTVGLAIVLAFRWQKYHRLI